MGDHLVDVMEWSWAAGFFDGEGSVGINASHSGKYKYLRLQVNQVRREPLERFQQAVGAGNITGPYAKNGPLSKQPQFSWSVTGKAAESVATLLMSMLSAPKKEQINAVRAELNGGE